MTTKQKQTMMQEVITKPMTEMTDTSERTLLLQSGEDSLKDTAKKPDIETEETKEQQQTKEQKQRERAISQRVQSLKSVLNAASSKSAVRKVYRDDQLPLRVGLRISVTEITHIDTTKQQYGIKGYLIYNWPATDIDVLNFLKCTKEESKAAIEAVIENDSKKATKDKRKYEPQFKPQLHFVNDVKIFDFEEKHDIKVEYGDDELPYNSQDLLFFNVIFTEEFNVKNFPFDVQDLRIVLTTTLHDSVDEIKLVPSALHKNQFKLDKTWSSIVTHWDVKNNDVSKAIIGAKSKESGKEYDVVLFRIQVKRKWKGLLWRLVAWLVLLGIMSCATFAIDAVEDPSGRLGYAVTMASTVIAFQFFISTYVPEVDYLTLMDKYNWFTFIFVLLITMQTAFLAFTGHYWSWRDKIDNACFGALAGIFFIGTVGFTCWAKYVSKQEDKKIKQWGTYEQIARTFIKEKEKDGDFDFKEIKAKTIELGDK